MRKTISLIAALAVAVPTLAAAHGNGNHRQHYNSGYAQYDQGYGRQSYNGYDARYDNSRYQNSRYDNGPSEWQGNDGRTYCRRSDGTVGLIVGGGAGALIGRAMDGGRNRATGTILGAAAGALIGQSIAKKRRCR